VRESCFLDRVGSRQSCVREAVTRTRTFHHAPQRPAHVRSIRRDPRRAHVSPSWAAWPVPPLRMSRVERPTACSINSSATTTRRLPPRPRPGVTVTVSRDSSTRPPSRAAELRRWSDGTTHLRFHPLELLERLASLTPRPRINLVLYYGVLGAHAAWRSRLPRPGITAPTAAADTATEACAGSACPVAPTERTPDPAPSEPARPARSGSKWLWAATLQIRVLDTLQSALPRAILSAGCVAGPCPCDTA
jgi:hypothetical protein